MEDVFFFGKGVEMKGDFITLVFVLHGKLQRKNKRKRNEENTPPSILNHTQNQTKPKQNKTNKTKQVTLSNSLSNSSTPSRLPPPFLNQKCIVQLHRPTPLPLSHQRRLANTHEIQWFPKRNLNKKRKRKIY